MRALNKEKSERGAALVELAVMLPLLLLILLGIIEFGLLFYNQQVLTNASREGARAGIARIDIDDTVLAANDIDDIVDSYCASRMITFDNVPPDINTTTVGLGGAFGDPLTVTLNYSYSFLVPKLLGLGTNFQLTTETMMRMERPLSS